jgi:hypothetical protein
MGTVSEADELTALLKHLSTPEKIQDYLDTLAINYEKNGETCLSPLHVIKTGKAHCLEAALLAAAALWLHEEDPLLMELSAAAGDEHHALALFKKNGYWGAISKTNHAALRFRDPIYRTPRELALSYFHEYFLNTTGQKMLRGYTKPFSLKRFGDSWITSDKDLWSIAYALRAAPHFPLVPAENRRYLRPADQIERKAGSIIEWPRSDPRT